MKKGTENYSVLQKERLEYQPAIAPIFKNTSINSKEGEEVKCVSNDCKKKKKKPKIF